MKKKPVIKAYYPQAVFLPDGVERVVPLKQQESIGRLLPPQKQATYDSKTLFYDLFVQSNRLICIGPPFYSIGAPQAIKHKGKKLHFKLITGHRWIGPTVIDIKIPSQWAQAAQLNLEFVFKEFIAEVSCQCNKQIALPKTNLCLTSVQKDNPIIWIKDWCRWYIRVCGVQRIVLYDNGSSYWPILEKELAEINEEVEIILVHWPYKYGPISDVLHDYKYSQFGMLSHFHLFFGIQTSWCINLDIDEFLYFDSPLPLKKYLMLPKNLVRPTIPLDHYLFPPGQAPAKKQARFYHHKMRYRPEYWNVKHNPKYICQPNRITQMKVHDCKSKKLRDILWLLIKKDAIPKKWGTIFYFLLNGKKKRLQQRETSEREKLFFCHLRDLCTGWYGDAPREDKFFINKVLRPVNSVDSAALTEDKRLIDKAIETGLVTEMEISQES